MFFFSIIDLHLLIPAVIAHMFNPCVELVISMGIPTNEANAKFETQSLTTIEATTMFYFI